MFDLADQLCSAYAPTLAQQNINVTPYIDRLVAMDDGAGAPIYWYTLCKAAPTSSGSATVQFQLIGNPSDPTFTSGNVTVLQTIATLYSNITINEMVTRMVIPRMPGGTAVGQTSLTTKGGLLRYWAFAVNIGTAALTAGSFTSYLTMRPLQDNLAYAAGFSFP